MVLIVYSWDYQLYLYEYVTTYHNISQHMIEMKQCNSSVKIGKQQNP